MAEKFKRPLLQSLNFFWLFCRDFSAYPPEAVFIILEQLVTPKALFFYQAIRRKRLGFILCAFNIRREARFGFIFQAVLVCFIAFVLAYLKKTRCRLPSLLTCGGADTDTDITKYAHKKVSAYGGINQTGPRRAMRLPPPTADTAKKRNPQNITKRLLSIDRGY